MSDADATADELRGEIEHTQEDLSATVDAIEERLNPQRLMEQAKETARATAEHAVAQATETAREATVGKVNQVVRNARATAKRVTGGAGARTTTVITRVGARVKGDRAGRIETGTTDTVGTEGQADPRTAAGRDRMTRRLPGWSAVLAAGLVGGLIIGVVLGRVLAKRPTPDAEASAAVLAPSLPQDVPSDVAAPQGWMIWKRA